MRPRYYNRKGEPVPLLEWARLLESHPDRIVRQKRLWWGGFLSTVWLGLDHSYGDGPPLIFESMLFTPGDRPDELDMDRYSTEAEVLKGHRRLFWKHFIPWAMYRALRRHESRMVRRVKEQAKAAWRRLLRK